MPGHDALKGLTSEQTGVELDGKFLLIKDGEPTDGTSGDLGYAKGALAINLSGSNAVNRAFVNVGTPVTPEWKFLQAGS